MIKRYDNSLDAEPLSEYEDGWLCMYDDVEELEHELAIAMNALLNIINSQKSWNNVLSARKALGVIK